MRKIEELAEQVRDVALKSGSTTDWCLYAVMLALDEINETLKSKNTLSDTDKECIRSARAAMDRLSGAIKFK
jgi:hypothetical protein